jgi:hypothetical protein
MNKDIFVKDWGTQAITIDLRERGEVIQMRPTEIHHKADGDTQDGPSFAIIMTVPGAPAGTPIVMAQVSFNMLKESLAELGYQLKRPEHEVWRWWVGTDQMPKYIKLNPANTVGERKVFRFMGSHDEAGRIWIETDDPNVGARGYLEAHYLLPATFEEYQQFMNAEAV